MNRRKNRKGFSLAELMLVVAIIIVLASLAYIGVARYLRGLRLLEMDNAAKEMYFAAQNRITAALVSGDLGRLKESDYSDDVKTTMTKTVKDGTEDKSVTLNVIKVSKLSSVNTANTLLDELLPFGSIDETLRANGSYIITYTFDAANNVADVWDVWYTSDDNAGFFRNWSGSEDELQKASNEELAAARMNMQDGKDTGRQNRLKFPNGNGPAVIGHYGSNGVSFDRKKLDVSFALMNDEALCLAGQVKVDGSSTVPTDIELQVNIIVEGLTSGAVKTLPPSDSKVSVKKDDGSFSFVLDDVTAKGKRFRDQFDHDGDDASKVFIPGEDIRVTVEVYTNSALANIDRAAAVDNSLFQYVKTETNDAKTMTIGEAGIGKIRHLQNLSSEVSNVELGIKQESDKTRLGINSALQIDDLDWNSFKGKHITHKIDDITVTVTTIGSDIWYNKGNGPDATNTTDSFLPINFNIQNSSNVDDYEKQFGTTVDPSETKQVKSFLYYDAGYKDEDTSEFKKHKISNLTVNGVNNAGLFGTLNSDTAMPETNKVAVYLLMVKNLDMTKPNITGNTTAGTVVADVQRAARITGVSVSDAKVAIADNKTGNAGGAVGQAANGLDLLTVTVTGNTQVSATNGNAGGLLGEMHGNVEKVHLTISDSAVGDKDSRSIAVASSGTGKAGGGLVGAITDGLPTIMNSYSTALVSGDTAGGLVGSVVKCYTDSKIISCYVGGHTVNAKYETDADKCNIRGTTTAGGFIGSVGTGASMMPIQSSYTTASVSAETAGGFVGEHAGGNISYCYAVGYVKDTTTADPNTTPSGAFVGNNLSSLTGSGNLYFELINGTMPAVGGAGTTTSFVITAAETDLSTYNAFVQLGSSGEFFPYDSMLSTMFGTNYFLPTVKDLDANATLTTHVGDWQPVDTLVFNAPNP